jgi:hypothetical protein
VSQGDTGLCDLPPLAFPVECQTCAVSVLADHLGLVVPWRLTGTLVDVVPGQGGEVVIALLRRSVLGRSTWGAGRALRARLNVCLLNRGGRGPLSSHADWSGDVGV